MKDEYIIKVYEKWCIAKNVNFLYLIQKVETFRQIMYNIINKLSIY